MNIARLLLHMVGIPGASQLMKTEGRDWPEADEIENELGSVALLLLRFFRCEPASRVHASFSFTYLRRYAFVVCTVRRSRPSSASFPSYIHS